MNISVVASGTRGDVQPYVALGKGLKAAGFNVRLITSDDFEGLVTGAGLEFASMGMSIEAMLQSDEWRAVTERGNFLVIVSRMSAEMKRRAADLVRHLPPLLADTDLIVTGAGLTGGTLATAEKLGIPIVQAYVFPITPTSRFPSPLTPTLPFGGIGNKLSFAAVRQMLWQSGRVGDVETRRMLGMPRGSFFGPFRTLDRQQTPVLYGYSPHVLPRPDDWGAHIHVTGYWFLDAPTAWTPPASLVDFLRAGPPPVYIGFGSMSQRNPEAATRLALEALARSGQRGVLASGWGGMSQAQLPDGVYMLSSAPHDWLFPQMGAVVHHGGAGTTAAGLRAGVPSIVVPFMGDQPFWGHRVAALGVGPAPIARRRLTAEALAAAITRAVSDAAMRQHAADLGARIRAEDGVGQAVTQIEQHAQQLPQRVRAALPVG